MAIITQQQLNNSLNST